MARSREQTRCVFAATQFAVVALCAVLANACVFEKALGLNEFGYKAPLSCDGGCTAVGSACDCGEVTLTSFCDAGCIARDGGCDCAIARDVSEAAVCRAVDCPGVDTECQTRVCTDNVCDVKFAEPSVSCGDGGGHCDGRGACEQPEAEASGPSFDCADGVQNFDETDEDCGGQDCGPCAALQHCERDQDCAAPLGCQDYPSRGKICYPASCNDERRNGDEGGVDCGGSCPAPCQLGEYCETASQCESRFCVETETAYKHYTKVCCGSACAESCSWCLEGSGVCEPVPDLTPDPKLVCDPTDVHVLGKACEAGACAHCSDGSKSANETAPDCGGGACEKCTVGQPCEDGPRDCVSGVCSESGDGMKCASARCTNDMIDGLETDIDCGGPCGALCSVGQRCRAKADCASGNCVGVGIGPAGFGECVTP